MKSFKGRKLRKKEVDALLEKDNWQIDAETSQILHENVYVNSSGEVLHKFFEGRGVLYDAVNGELFKEAIQKTAKQKPSHMLTDVFHYREEFVDLASGLSNRVVERFAGEDLDYSLNSLGVLDRNLKRLTRIEVTKPELVTELIAYVGEVLIRNHEGRWIMRPTGGEIMEPWVEINSGRLIPVFALVYREIFEGFPNMSIQGMVEGEIKTTISATGSRDQLKNFTVFNRKH